MGCRVETIVYNVVCALILASFPAFAVDITAASDDTITLGIGSASGVRVGMTGHISTRQVVAGSPQSFDIARFEITVAQASSSTARLTQVGEGWTVEVGMEVVFDQPLSPPAPDKTVVVIRSNVSDDVAYIDGRRLGPTPQEVEVEPGIHVVRVAKYGYEDFDESVDVSAGREITVRAELAPLTLDASDLLREANASFEKGDLERAAHMYQRFLLEVPDDPFATKRLEQIGKARRADEEMARVPAYRIAMRNLRSEGQFAAAGRYASKILGVLPSDKEASQVLSMLKAGKADRIASINSDIEAGQFDTALSTANELLLSYPEDQEVVGLVQSIEFEFSVADARSMVDEGRFEDARAILAHLDVPAAVTNGREIVEDIFRGTEPGGGFWVWGDNRAYNFGNGGDHGSEEPVFVIAPSILEQIAAFNHVLARDRSGRVWAWGGSGEGWVLGKGKAEDVREPVRVSLSGARFVGVGNLSNLVIDSNGHLFTWGWNAFFQLGSPSELEIMRARSQGAFDIDRKRASPKRVEGLPAVRFGALGGSHLLVVDESGRVWAWGDNEGGQIGIKVKKDAKVYIVPKRVPGLDDVREVVGGYQFSLALKSDGSVWAWGSNEDGKLGINRPGVTSNPTQVEGLPSISHISSGSDHTLALAHDGSVWSWGDNSDGALGIATTASSPTPVRVAGLPRIKEVSAGAGHSLALAEDGRVFCWGGMDAKVPSGCPTANPSLPGEVVGLTDRPRHISAGRNISIALR